MRQGVGDRGGLADRPEGQRNPRKQLHFGCGSAEGDPGFFWFGDSDGGCQGRLKSLLGECVKTGEEGVVESGLI